jgi:putative peptide zinc metalloprotease protein
VAIQVVLIFSDPEVVTTDNLALALNTECISCETMALAYQYVLTTNGPVHFTADGNKAINDILKQISEIGANEGSTLEEIAAQIDALVEELYAVVDTELVSASQPPTSEEEQVASQTATPAPTTVETTPAPESTPTAEETPSSTPTSETTPTSSESSTSEPSATSEPTTESTP